jgi:uncharacterized membrane protein
MLIVISAIECTSMLAGNLLQTYLLGCLFWIVVTAVFVWSSLLRCERTLTVFCWKSNLNACTMYQLKNCFAYLQLNGSIHTDLE